MANVEKPGTRDGSVFDRAAGAYGSVGPNFYAHFGRRIVEHLALTEGASVLDLACGTGAALVPASHAVGITGVAVGVDLSEAMLQRAHEWVNPATGHGLAVARMDAQRLALRAGVFDAVVSSFALGSFPDPLGALAECRRVTRPGGVLGLVVADRWWWEGDKEWSWHGDLLASIGVQIPAARFHAEDPIRAALQNTKWEPWFIRIERFPMVFSGPQEWWAWAWSHGFRGILEGMDAAAIGHYRTECFRRLRTPSHARLEVFVAAATKPIL